MRNIGYYNGKVGPLEEMTVPMNDRALYFGDGVYDVVTLIRGKFFALEDHIDRFFHCCRQLEMPLPIPDEVTEDPHAAVAENTLPSESRDSKLCARFYLNED